MAISKGMVLCLCMFMLSGLLTSYIHAKEISYGAIGKGDHILCDRRSNPSLKNCQATKPANPYNRGCEKAEKCRNG
ncbi:hypothetical protein ACB098_11G031800 [Castanea mollissima]